MGGYGSARPAPGRLGWSRTWSDRPVRPQVIVPPTPSPARSACADEVGSRRAARL